MLYKMDILNESPPVDPTFSDADRLVDGVIAGVCLLILLPLFATLALGIKIITGRSVFRTNAYVGKWQNVFTAYQFVNDKHRLMHIINKALLLVNVFTGTMSIVGPRPIEPQEASQVSKNQQTIFSVQPGIISPASFTNHTDNKTASVLTLPERIAVEQMYLKHRTVFSDLVLLQKAIFSIFLGKRNYEPTFHLRNRHIFILDVLVLLITPVIALNLRVEQPNWYGTYGIPILIYAGVALVMRLIIFYQFGLYRRYWRYASIGDLSLVFFAVTFSTILLTTVFIAFNPELNEYGVACPRSLPIIDGLLSGLLVGSYRLGWRGMYQWRKQKKPIGGRRVLVVGAGEAGTVVVKELHANPQLQLEPVAFADDDPAKQNIQVQGLPVLGTLQQLPKLVEEYNIQQVLVAMPSAPLPVRREILNLCEKLGVEAHSLPGIYELLAGYKTIHRLPQYDIYKLLHRPQIEVGLSDVSTVINGATVLVTGAGGSIGSELCRQIARLNPKSIVLLGHGENSIFEIALELRLSFPNLLTHSIIIDIRDRERVNWAFRHFHPQVVFHAAAHKHVPFMEDSIGEAVTNNILGSYNILQAAERYDVQRLVAISTDKAVNPTSIMGATKRMVELMVMSTAKRSKKAFMAVRFGNVLGSRGSVIPVFQRQIAAGGPLTVTHPDMTRYFMTIPEAVGLVLESSALGSGGEVFVLDMGEPVRILDLAGDMLKLAGLEPQRDIEVVFSGIRPGEKLNEELFLTGENHQRTRHQKIFVSARDDIIPDDIEEIIRQFSTLTRLPQKPETIIDIKNMLANICGYQEKRPVKNTAPSPLNENVSNKQPLQFNPHIIEAFPQKS